MPVGLKRNGRLKKGYRFAKGGRVVKARGTRRRTRRAAAKSTRRPPTRRARRTTSRRKTSRRKSGCVAFKLPPRGRGGRFVKRRSRRR